MREVMIFTAEFDPDEEPIPFELRITNTRTNEVRTESFEAMADPGIGGDLAVTAISQFDARTGKRVTDLNGLRRFFQRVLIDDGYERLDALLEDKTVSVPMSMLGAVFNRLVSVYAARPTQPSSGSSNGRPGTGLSSTVAS